MTLLNCTVYCNTVNQYETCFAGFLSDWFDLFHTVDTTIVSIIRIIRLGQLGNIIMHKGSV